MVKKYLDFLPNDGIREMRVHVSVKGLFGHVKCKLLRRWSGASTFIRYCLSRSVHNRLNGSERSCKKGEE